MFRTPRLSTNSRWVTRTTGCRFSRSTIMPNPNCAWGLSNGIPTGFDMNTGVTNPLFYGFPKVSISGFTTLEATGPSSSGRTKISEFLDHISYLHGKHAFKFGGEYTYVETTSGATSNAKGRINFKTNQGD